MDHERWPLDNAALIGQRVAFLRDRRKMSAQQLAERCAALGMPAISRIVITKLENGRREAVSTAELLVLAEALGAAPAALLFPIGYTPSVEVLPGREMTPWDAWRWFVGGAALVSAPGIDPDSPVVLWTDHEHLTGSVALSRKRLRETQKDTRAGSENDGKYTSGWKLELDATLRTLARLRAQMRSLGMTPPPVDEETARELGEAAPDGSR